MLIKKCGFCGKNIETNLNIKQFCDTICQRKNYNRKPEIREKNKLKMREYRKNHPEWKEKHRILAVTRYRVKRAEYQKKYSKIPEVRERIRREENLRRKTDLEFAITDRLRRSLNHALTKYSKTEKIMSSKKYGINWKEIIESLKPFPNNLKDYEVDHIIPLRSFDLTDITQVKKAFSPSNLQWLTIHENRKKSGKLIINQLDKNKFLNEDK